MNVETTVLNLVALRAAVFMLSGKNRGADIRPGRALVKFVIGLKCRQLLRGGIQRCPHHVPNRFAAYVVAGD